jgi:hypothetical protein
VHVWADISAYWEQRRPGPQDDGALLVLSFYGKGIVMRPVALREATAKAAATPRRKLAIRLSPGEKNGRKRMAEIAVVYDAVPAQRSPADVIRPPGSTRDAPHEPGPKAEGMWLTASVTDDIAAVVAAGFGEAERCDPGRQRTWIALVDGNRAQIEATTAEAARRGVTVSIVIDFIHVLEYLWNAAWSFFEHADPAAEEWVAAQAAKILEGRAAQVAAGIRRRATMFGYSPAERAGADECAR